jgi:hypothetical protein
MSSEVRIVGPETLPTLEQLLRAHITAAAAWRRYLDGYRDGPDRALALAAAWWRAEAALDALLEPPKETPE